MSIPSISVVIPVFNCEKYIAKCLDSVLEQTFQDFEVVVVDDGSTDSTQQSCLNYVKTSLGKVSYHYQKNMGPASARNAGIKIAQGRYISFLDADDYWDRKFLEIMFGELTTSEYDIVVCYNYRLELTNGSVIKREIDTTCSKIETSQDLFKEFLRKDLIGGPARMLCKKALLDEIGAYDEGFYLTECWDLWIRFFRKKRRVKIIKTPLYYYHVRDDGSNITRRAKAWDRVYEFYLIYKKHGNSIRKDVELKRAFSEGFWNGALGSPLREKKFLWRIYLVMLSQFLNLSFLAKSMKFFKNRLRQDWKS